MKRGRAFLRLLLALMVLASLCAVPRTVQAAKAKDITAKTEKKYKKAPKLKKGRLYRVIQSKNNRVVRFVAPEKGTYVITAAGLRSIGNGKKKKTDTGYGWLYVSRGSAAGLIPRKIATEGGKGTSLCLITYAGYQKLPEAARSKLTAGSWLKKRTATLNLKKKETVYLQMNFRNRKDLKKNTGKCFYKVIIQKK